MTNNIAYMACPVCGGFNSQHWATSYDVEYFTSDNEFEYQHCISCDVLYLINPPIDSLKSIYPKNYYSYSSKSMNFISRIKNALDIRLLKSIIISVKSEKINVLDVGGGMGWNLDHIKTLDKRVVFTQVVDLDEDAEKIARENGHDYFCGRIEDFNTSMKFDFILMLNLIEHVVSPKEVLIKLHDLLTEEGVVLIKTPNFDSLDARIFKHKSWAGYHCPRHWVLFTMKSFHNICAETKFNVERFSYTQGAPFWAASVLSVLARHNIINLSEDMPATRHFLFAPFSVIFALMDFIRRPFFKTSQMFFLLKK
jgi:2-polyprenyl-3-methyl-5-hydroxy-6-metoxy-1,4-benzoquinol methylase